MLARYSIIWLAALLLLPTAVHAQAVLTSGQISFIELSFTNTNLTDPWKARINDETNLTLYDAAPPGSASEPYLFNAPGGARFRIAGSQHLFQRPASSEWNFIGVNGGEMFRATPQNGDPASRLILGISTVGVPNIFAGGKITITMSVTGITNPGQFSYYVNDGGFNEAVGILSPPPLFSTLQNIDTLLFDTGTANSFNMAFSAAGIYDVDFQFSGTRTASAGGGTFVSPFYRYTFDVAAFAVPEPATWGLLATSLLVAGGYGLALRRRHRLLMNKPLSH